MKNYLIAEAGKIIKNKIKKRRNAQFKDINFKFKSPHVTHEDKNNFMEYGIEDCLKYFGQRHNGENIKDQHYLKKVKKQITNNLFYWSQGIKKR